MLSTLLIRPQTSDFKPQALPPNKLISDSTCLPYHSSIVNLPLLSRTQLPPGTSPYFTTSYTFGQIPEPFADFIFLTARPHPFLRWADC